MGLRGAGSTISIHVVGGGGGWTHICALTYAPHHGVADEQGRLAERSEVLRRVLDGVGALNVLGGRPEEAFGHFARVHHLSVVAVR